MGLRRPPRLPGCSYRGFGRYFVTIHAAVQTAPFGDPSVAGFAVEQILRCASEAQFAVLAYCVMPTHLHLLLETCQPKGDLRRCISSFKQATGFAHRKRTGQRLWQDGYYDRILRSDEGTEAVVGYIWMNPVRAGLADTARQWPFSGGSWGIECLIEDRVVTDWEPSGKGGRAGAEAPALRRG